MITEKFKADGMMCASCAAHVTKAAMKCEGVINAAVSLTAGTVRVTYDEALTDAAAIMSAVTDAGYACSPAPAETAESIDKSQKARRNVVTSRLIFSCIFTLPLLYVSMGHMIGAPLPSFMNPHTGSTALLIFAIVQLVLCLPVLIVNRIYFTDGAAALFRLAPNMNTLVATGAAASYLYSLVMTVIFASGRSVDLMASLYIESAAVILTLITFGKFLEDHAKGRAANAVTSLLKLSPKTAEIVTADGSTVIESALLETSDRVIIRAGGSVPADGEIIEGSGAFDEAMLTGESLPVEKSVGDNVICGSVMASGYIVFKPTRIGSDATPAQIARMVEDASAVSSDTTRLVDKISLVFVPAVMIIAVAVFAVWFIISRDVSAALNFGISVLVISCPCALGLATPVAVTCGIGRGAKIGILIKSFDALEMASRADTVILDKTGTVTYGKMSVCEIISAVDEYGSRRNAAGEITANAEHEFNSNITESQRKLLSVAASLEYSSEHPIGKAICDFARLCTIDVSAADNFVAEVGGGVSGSIGGVTYRVGNKTFAESAVTSVSPLLDKASDELADEGKTSVFIASENDIIGIIALADTIKPTSAEAVRRFNSLGLSVTMLTGDNETTAAAIGRRAGIGNVIAGALPEDKQKTVEKARTDGHTVIFIGDGINDSPALSSANVGIAIGTGSDIALDCASVVLSGGELTRAADAITLSHAVVRNIRENLIWAFLYNALCIPLAAGVLSSLGIVLNPMIAAAAMSFSSLSVVLNALRLLRFSPVKHRDD